MRNVEVTMHLVDPGWCTSHSEIIRFAGYTVVYQIHCGVFRVLRYPETAGSPNNQPVLFGDLAKSRIPIEETWKQKQMQMLNNVKHLQWYSLFFISFAVCSSQISNERRLLVDLLLFGYELVWLS